MGWRKTTEAMIRVRAFYILLCSPGLGSGLEEEIRRQRSMNKGLIGSGWRLFVEFDSYAIASICPRLPTWAGGGNLMGLIHEARGPTSLFSRSVARADRCSLHILALE